jgi:hypothetical protein
MDPRHPTSLPEHGPVVLQAPDSGWSWEAYQQAIAAFTRARGQAPRRISLHPETLEEVLRTRTLHGAEGLTARALGVAEKEEAWLRQLLAHEQEALQVQTVPEQDRATLVLE